MCLCVRASVCADMLQYILLRNKSVCTLNCHEQTHHWLRRMAAGHVRYRSSLIFFFLPSTFSSHPSVSPFSPFLLALLVLLPVNCILHFFFHKFPQQEQACSGGESHRNSVYSPSDVWNWSFASFNPSSLHRKLYLLSQWCRSYHKLEFYSKKTSINDFLIPHFCHMANQ